MASLNKVFLMGNFTRDPEYRQIPGGSTICTFGLAVNRQFTSARGETREEVCFVDIETWGRTAESVNQFVRKGYAVFVEGRLRYDQWDDRETGKKRSRLTVSAERVQFLNPPQGGQQAGGQYGNQYGGYEQGDYAPQPPRPQYSQPRQPAPQYGSPAPQYGNPGAPQQYQEEAPAAPQYNRPAAPPPAGGSMPAFEGMPDSQPGDDVPF